MNNKQPSSEDRFSDVKPANALNTLGERSRASRVWIVIIALVGVIVFAFLGGALFRAVTGGTHTPEIPAVEL